MNLPHLNYRKDMSVKPVLREEGRMLFPINLEPGAVMKMIRRKLCGVKQFLRSPSVIIGEIAADLQPAAPKPAAPKPATK